MATTIFPENADVASESALTSWAAALVAGQSFVVSGYTLSAGAGLTVDVAAGAAMVDGYHLVSDATQNETVAASDVNYIFLGVNGSLTVNVTGTAPANSIALGTATTDGSGVTSVSHYRATDGPYHKFLQKFSDDSVSASTTYQADVDLTFDVNKGEIWSLYMQIRFDTDSTPDIKFRLVSASAAMRGLILGHEEGRGTPQASTADGSTLDFGGIEISATGDDAAEIRAVIVAEADDTITLEWAQRISDAYSTKVLKESYLVAQRILV